MQSPHLGEVQQCRPVALQDGLASDSLCCLAVGMRPDGPSPTLLTDQLPDLKQASSLVLCVITSRLCQLGVSASQGAGPRTKEHKGCLKRMHTVRVTGV